MSVLACNRKGCENIMCDRLSHTYGYICKECFEELIIASPYDLESFMESKKGGGQGRYFRREVLDVIFPLTPA